VVEDIRDVIAIENTGHFKGLYHVLGGLISPLDGIGPEKLNLSLLFDRLQNKKVEEVILALSTTIQGDTTSFYISNKLKDTSIKVTTLSRGIAIGGELEYADELTLAKSLTNRVLYQK
jgi:recombination protein RecR